MKTKYRCKECLESVEKTYTTDVDYYWNHFEGGTERLTFEMEALGSIGYDCPLEMEEKDRGYEDNNL